MTVDMSDVDEAMKRYDIVLENSKEIAKKMLENGADIPFIIKTTGLPEKVIREL